MAELKKVEEIVRQEIETRTAQLLIKRSMKEAYESMLLMSPKKEELSNAIEEMKTAVQMDETLLRKIKENLKKHQDAHMS